MSKRKAEDAFSMDSFLNDSDVDDDDLLLLMKPSGLKKVASPTSATSMEENQSTLISQEEGSSNSPPSDTNSPLINRFKSVDVDQEASKEAQRVFQFQTDYQAIHSTSLLKWYAVPRKGKKKGPNKCSMVYPCYICPNPEQAMAGHDDEVHLSQRNDTIIRYIGCKTSCRNQIQAVPAAHLLDFNYQPIDTTNISEEVCNTWCPTFMTTFLNSLLSLQEFKGSSENERNLKIKTEEKLLDLILVSVLEKEEQSKNTIVEDTKGAVSDDLDGEDAEDAPLEWSSPKAQKPSEDEIAHKNEPKISTTLPSNRIIVPKRLRAGDIIECCPPHMVADKSRLERSRVLECHPGADPAVLLSSGHWLPQYHQIRIVQRLLRGQYEPCHGPFVRISSLILDKRQNNMPQPNGGPTLAERVGKVYQETVREVAAFQKSDDPAQDVDDGSSDDAKSSKISSKSSSSSGRNRSKRTRTQMQQQ